jgi:hypothetical protein
MLENAPMKMLPFPCPSLNSNGLKVEIAVEEIGYENKDEKKPHENSEIRAPVYDAPIPLQTPEILCVMVDEEM